MISLHLIFSLKPDQVPISNVRDLTGVDLQFVIPNLITNCDAFETPETHHMLIMRDWIGLAIVDRDFLYAGIFLAACRNILHHMPHDPLFTELALQYRQRAIQSLRQVVSDAGIRLSTVTIAKALALAFDEVSKRKGS